MDNKTTGKRGEGIAARYLENKGYEIQHRNYRARQYGEVDIIARHPHKKLLIFVEVKTRVGIELGRPEEAITPAKKHELKKMVDYYYNEHPRTSLSPQIDVVAIILNSDQAIASLEHFENITL